MNNEAAFQAATNKPLGSIDVMIDNMLPVNEILKLNELTWMVHEETAFFLFPSPELDAYNRALKILKYNGFLRWIGWN